MIKGIFSNGNDESIRMANYDYIEKRLEEKASGLLSFPRYFLIETVHACNAACIMCPVKEAPLKRGRMATEMFNRITAEIIRHAKAVRRVQLHLHGEPCLDPRLPEFIRAYRDDAPGIVTHVATNASLLSEELSEAYLKAGLGQIYLAIDGYTEATYNAIRIGLSLADVRQNALNFIKLRDKLKAQTKIRVLMVVQEKNRHELKDWRLFWGRKLRRTDELVAVRVSNWGGQVDTGRDYRPQDDAVSCISPFGTMAITADGAVPLCCIDSKPTHRMGMVGESSIAEIWRTKSFERVRNLHLDGKRADIALCRGCDVWQDEKHIEDR